MAEVIKAKDEGIIYKHRDGKEEKRKILWESPDRRKLLVVMANNYPEKIVTAYRIPQKDWNKIMENGEKLAR